MQAGLKVKVPNPWLMGQGPSCSPRAGGWVSSLSPGSCAAARIPRSLLVQVSRGLGEVAA